jgi:hypothetical protein
MTEPAHVMIADMIGEDIYAACPRRETRSRRGRIWRSRTAEGWLTGLGRSPVVGLVVPVGE